MAFFLRFSLFLFFALWLSLLPAQVPLEAGFHYGKLLKINPVFPPVTQNAWSFDLGWQIPAAPHKPLPLKNARWWLNFQFHQLGNPDVLGYALTLLPNLEIPVWQGPHGRLVFRQGIFLGWTTQPYDRQTNPHNNIIGGHLNLYSQTRLSWQQSVQGGWSWALGMSYSHFSNGNTRVPNIGVNVPAIFLQIRSGSLPQPGLERKSSSLEGKAGWATGARVGLGRHAFKASGGPQYSAYSLGLFETFQPVGKTFRWMAGTEWFFDQGSYAFAREQESGWPSRRALGGALFVGGELMLNHLSFVLQTGPYLKVPFPHNWKVYTRFGAQLYRWSLQERPHQQWFLGFYVHAHGGEADYLDLSLGRMF